MSYSDQSIPVKSKSVTDRQFTMALSCFKCLGRNFWGCSRLFSKMFGKKKKKTASKIEIASSPEAQGNFFSLVLKVRGSQLQYRVSMQIIVHDKRLRNFQLKPTPFWCDLLSTKLLPISPTLQLWFGEVTKNRSIARNINCYG